MPFAVSFSTVSSTLSTWNAKCRSPQSACLRIRKPLRRILLNKQLDLISDWIHTLWGQIDLHIPRAPGFPDDPEAQQVYIKPPGLLIVRANDGDMMNPMKHPITPSPRDDTGSAQPHTPPDCQYRTASPTSARHRSQNVY